MPGNKKLFLSAVSREFLAYRELLAQDLARPTLDNINGTLRGPADDLAEVRRLIFRHGYLRREEELEVAEAVLKHFGKAATQ